MSRTSSFLLSTVFIVLSSSTAQAGIFDKTPTDGAGLYVSGFVGVGLPFDADLSDIRWTENQKIVPYIGGGIGLGIVDSDIQYFPNNGAFTAPSFAVQGQDTGFATVSTAGVTLNATEKFDIYAEGRYFKTYGVDAERRFINAGADGFSAEVDDNPDGLAFTVGTRLKF